MNRENAKYINSDICMSLSLWIVGPTGRGWCFASVSHRSNLVYSSIVFLCMCMCKFEEHLGWAR